jgi:hypothetical protein
LRAGKKPQEAEQAREELVLRNNRLGSVAWLLTAAVFAVVGLLALGGFIVANVRDPEGTLSGARA